MERIIRMGMLVLMMGLALRAATAWSDDMVEETVTYEHNGQTLEGFLVYNHSAYADGGNRPQPGVLLVHEWWGLNAFARWQARALAEESGYVVFALDMYGRGKVTDDPQQAAAWAGEFRGGEAAAGLMRERAAAGMAVLAGRPEVDPRRLGAIGFCFGGTTVLQLAFSGADLKGVVSLHGGLFTPTAEDTAQTRASILVLHGAADPHVSQEAIDGFTGALGASEVDWQMVWFGGAVHAFTNPKADAHGLNGVAYNDKAAARAHRHTALFLQEVFDR